MQFCPLNFILLISSGLDHIPEMIIEASNDILKNLNIDMIYK